MTVSSLIALGVQGISMGNDSFEAPGLNEFFPNPIFFAGTPFEMNRVMLIRLISATVLLILCILYAKRAKLVPGRAQATMEALLDFSRIQIGEEIMGGKARRYQPFIATIFLGVLFMNITGIIPGLQLAATSVVGMPIVYAIFGYITFIVAGIMERGCGRFFKEQLFPPGVPKALYILLTPIEFISNFVVRPVTLVMRLLANMLAGHMLLVVCFVGTHFLLFSMSGASGIAFGTLTFMGGIMAVLFEAFVACIQAYIFAMLSAVYIQLSISSH
ncbi:F0F1 ATP synthase subunit A [Actinotignum urinale]|uniref:ATP synthase subunit a n=1 Tax=Actinotignum urinale TaxID=190146 RepID=A0AAW9HMW6_9ACTO|nr:F0F1 ATP synthase subunit A [Actinotignum urinale]MDY5129438.1 F0F1 ATP synthase subunit A [Actinotignum urinale]MDY5132891.1 F0F1 ATP synthase subunit A [Actinotignum urinale]MDY5151605.1 F0F1 ATP synthase subunit A [Actinotignum urinale]MDY5155253.1 F0F1 ATP synthase subunit A [Actinotignum urinale]MDY5161040.1 F0F1 ATP synthase subunit A [Actinotignum urinale]